MAHGVGLVCKVKVESLDARCFSHHLSADLLSFDFKSAKRGRYMSVDVDFSQSNQVFQAANIQAGWVYSASFFRRVLLTLLLVSLLTACTSQSTLTPPPVRQSPTTTTQTGPTCQTSQLTLAYDRSNGLVANRADQFSLQNTSTSTCTLFGYPHIQMLLADGHPTPTHAMQATSAYLFQAALKVVALQTGAKSYFIVEWVAGTCVDSASTAGEFLQVTPPGNTGILTTSARAGADGGIDACGNIVVSPVSAMSILY